MTSAEETMRALNTALASGDIETFVNAIDDNAVAKVHGPTAHSGEYVGKPAILGMMQSAMSAIEESQTIDQYVASGDTVVVFGQETLTDRQTGKSDSGAFAHRWVVRDGKIVEFEDFGIAGADLRS